MSEPRRIWLALEGSEIVEMKQVVLDRDVPGAAAFFRWVVVPQVGDVVRRRRILLEETGVMENDERLPG
jgi:hypothetical protein